jgi:hypothetical protein
VQQIREGLEVGRLAARRRSHRLVETSETPVHVAERHLGEPQLRERPQLEIRVVRGKRDVECDGRKRRGGRSISRALRAGELEPAPLRARRDVTEQALRPREPTTRGSIVVERKPVLTGKPERHPRSARQLAVPAEARVRALTIDDGASLVAEPPQRAPEPIKRLCRVRRVERVLKRGPRAFPITARERLIPTTERCLRRSRRHERIVAPAPPTRHRACRRNGICARASGAIAF